MEVRIDCEQSAVLDVDQLDGHVHGNCEAAQEEQPERVAANNSNCARYFLFKIEFTFFQLFGLIVLPAPPVLPVLLLVLLFNPSPLALPFHALSVRVGREKREKE